MARLPCVVRALDRQEVFYRAIVTHDLDSSIRCPSSEIQKVCLAFRIRLDAVNHEPYGAGVPSWNHVRVSIANCGFPTIRLVFKARRLVEKRPLP